MREPATVLLSKPVDNSRIVRQPDPHARKEVWLVILLLAVLAVGLFVYAYPALEIRRCEQESVLLYREREQVLEQKRKLQLERAALENLSRIETIAVRDLALQPPRPEQSVVVEVPTPLPKGATVARESAPAREARATNLREAQP